MSDGTDRMHLDGNHRTTLDQIERHPTTHNLEWHDVIGLLNEVGEVVQEHDGKFRVTLGDHRLILTKPKHKDVPEQMVLDLRRLLAGAGYFESKD